MPSISWFSAVSCYEKSPLINRWDRSQSSTVCSSTVVASQKGIWQSARTRTKRSRTQAPVTYTCNPAFSEKAYLGVDFGTSGARAVCITGQQNVLCDTRIAYAKSTKASWAEKWQQALDSLLLQVPETVRSHLARIAIAGTTTTSLLVDRHNGQLLADAILYNQPQSQEIVKSAQSIVPTDHSAGASVSSLCKLLYWQQQGTWQQAQEGGAEPGLLHHADWLAALLHGRWTCTDWHNAARLGYDAAAGSYPAWLLSQEFASVLPMDVYEPGSPVSPVTAAASKRWGIPTTCAVCAGTTDSVAAFLAAGVQGAGEGVSSLGSTLAIDLLSSRPVDAARYGICSYRWHDHWIVDGGSNTGGAVLQKYFTTVQLLLLSQQINPHTSTGLDYYPLLGRGQRFPVNDPDMMPRLTPRPESDAMFLQGLLEGIARIEAESYELLEQLGATPVKKVHTAGGGAASDVWNTIRQGMLAVPVVVSQQAEAAYGAALLAQQCLMPAGNSTFLQCKGSDRHSVGSPTS